MSRHSVDTFLKAYPPDLPRRALSKQFFDEFQDELPAQILELFSKTQLGKLRHGMFELIDPREYSQQYQLFFGGDAAGRIPFMSNAFGEFIACKPLQKKEYEISILHTYGPKLEVLTLEVADFFESVLGTDDGLLNVINVPLFNELSAEHPRLRAGQSYGFDPLLLSEGADKRRANASMFEVVDTLDHSKLLLRRALVAE